MTTTLNGCPPSSHAERAGAMPCLAHRRPSLDAYPDTLTVLRWRGFVTVTHDARDDGDLLRETLMGE